MKSISIIFFILTIFFIENVHAQNAIFLSQGRIEFEKKFSIYAMIDEQMKDETDETWSTLEKKMSPQFKITYFNLQFSGSKTLYSPGRDNPDNNNIRQYPVEDNVVYTDLEDSSSISQKNVFDAAFLIKDSTRKIKWKITDETRNIAGFDCRRANAIIMDSIYVVAYYTDQIITTGGPESFNGLPGMILGLALPHEHITWFATKVYADKVLPIQLIPPTKGKKTDSSSLLLLMQKTLKDWGNYGKPFLRQIMI